MSDFQVIEYKQAQSLQKELQDARRALRVTTAALRRIIETYDNWTGEPQSTEDWEQAVRTGRIIAKRSTEILNEEA